MNSFSMKKLGLAAAICLVSGLLLGCEEKGPAEKAGEKVDNAAKAAKDAVDPRGAGEKAGEKVDKALGK